MSSELLDQLGWRNDTKPLQFLGEAGFLWSYMGRWTEAEAVFKALVVLVPGLTIFQWRN